MRERWKETEREKAWGRESRGRKEDEREGVVRMREGDRERGRLRESYKERDGKIGIFFIYSFYRSIDFQWQYSAIGN